MPFTSQDDLLAQITAGKYLRANSTKQTAPVANSSGWHCLAGANGYPTASTYPSAQDLVFRSVDEVAGDGTTVLGIQHGGIPGGNATKHIVNVGANAVAAAGAPWQLKLVDLQCYYRFSGANVTGTGARTLINSNTVSASSSTGLLLTYTNDFNTYTKVRFTTTGTLPVGLSVDTDYWLVRQNATTAKVATSYANALAGTVIAYTDGGSGTHTMMCQTPRAVNGVGCEAFFVVQTLPTAGGPTISASAYDDTATYSGAGTRAFPGTPTFNATADSYLLRIPHSGNAAGRYGPFLPKQGGDKGIARINSVTLSGGTAYTGAGVLALCIVKPLLDIALPATGLWCERDLVNQLPSLPKVDDGACLVWMMFGTGATTTLTPVATTLDFAWGG